LFQTVCDETKNVLVGSVQITGLMVQGSGWFKAPSNPPWPRH